LERFATGGQIELVERDDPSWSRRLGVAAALAENYFYSIDTEDGRRDPMVEEMFAKEVEGPAAEAIRRVFDEGRPLNAPGPRERISVFLAFQYVRGWRTREAALEQHKASMRVLAMMATPAMVREGAQKRGEDMSEEEAAEIAAYANAGDFTIQIPHEANNHLGLVLPMVPELVKFFYARMWRVLEFEAPALLTSDEPVALVGGDPLAFGQAGGLASAAHIAFPVDPRRALVMSRPDLPLEEGRCPGAAEDAMVVNRQVAYGAHRFLVRSPGTDPLAGFVLPKRAPSVSITPTSDGYIVGMNTNSSPEHQARVEARIREKYGAPGPDGRPRPRRAGR
jgi:hypothetical protein